MAISISVLVVLTAGGAWFYCSQERQMRAEAETSLETIVRLKASQIVQWRAERLIDAALLMESPFLQDAIARWLTEPRTASSESILARFRSLQKHHRFHDVLLLDARGEARLSLSGRTGRLHGEAAQTSDTAFNERRPVMSEIHSGPGDLPPHIDVIAPFFSGSTEAPEPIGAILLQIDARQFLYPLIESWPTPSRSAETLLVRRDGDSVLFLNDLRHRPGTALELRIPLSREDVPAVMAVMGKEGTVDGQDYRGVQVLSVLKAIPDSQWFMVAKIDTAEALAVWRSSSVLIMALILCLLAAAAASAGAVWQRLAKAQYRTLFRAEAARRESEERFRITLMSIGDAVIAADADGRVVLLNPVAETLTGWQNEEAQGNPMPEVFRIVNEKTRLAVEDPVARVLREGVIVGLANHTILISRDGKEYPIADSGAPIRDETGAISGVVLVFRDQTEARRTEQEILNNAARLRSLVGILQHRSQTTRELLDYSLNEAIKLTGSKIGYIYHYHEDRKEFVLNTWSKEVMSQCAVMNPKTCYELEKTGVWGEAVRQRKPIILNDFQARHPLKKGYPEGHAELFKYMTVPVFVDERIVAVVGVANKETDYDDMDVLQLTLLMDNVWKVVDRKRLEDELRHNEERFRAAFRTSPDSININRLSDGLYVEINDGFSEITGYTVEDVIGKTSLNINMWVDPKDRELLVAGLNENGFVANLEARFRAKSGETRIGLMSARIILLDGVPHILSVTRDITDRKRAEDELRRLAEAVRQASEAVVVTSPDGSIEYVNPAFGQITGYTPEETIGRNPRILKSGKQDETFYGDLWATITAGERWAGRLVNKRKDGARYTAECSISPVKNDHGKIEHFVWVTRDITRELELEERFRQTERLESVGRLAAGVAHDLNNLLSPVLGYSELLLDELDHSEDLRQQVQVIKESAERSRDLIHQLLAFARKQVFEIKVLDLRRVVGGMEKLLRRTIRENIEIKYFSSPEICRVSADAGQVGQVLMNLAVNAQDSMPDGGAITIEVSLAELDEEYCLTRASATPGKYVMMAVSDNGSGMDEETQQHIFEPFFTTKKDQGTGLGLATVYGIVKQHGGNIWVYSEPGKGTTFKVYLPFTEGEEASESAPAIPISTMRGSETILVVEDNEMMRNMVRRILEKLGYAVFTAANGQEALERLAAHTEPLHLLLTDVIMPDMNGKVLFGRLQEEYPELRVLFMSGYTANVIAHHGVLEEGIHFIQKPFAARALAEKIRRVLDG
jgi:PAS domain S-box-containing protein